jgi:diguanylate cyclase (GGDEF)-like protein
MSINAISANSVIADTAGIGALSTMTGKDQGLCGPPLLNSTILMVDDEPITMEVARAFLEEAGYRHFMIIDQSPLALAAIERHQPDLVLLDLMMPDVSGIEILDAVRRHPKLEHLPVIVLTSSTNSEVRLKALELGATDFLSKPVDPSELCLRVRNTLSAKAYQDQLIYFGGLTGLPNWRLFLERLTAALHNAGESGEPVAILHINLDRFERINDSLGPKRGDAVLKEVGHRFRQGIRTEDLVVRGIPLEGRQTMSRLGSDEFAIILQGNQHMEKAAAVARRILDDFKLPIPIDGCDVFVTPSIGIAGYPEDAADPDLLRRHARSATQSAKQRGGNTFMYYSREINERSFEKLRLEGQLRKAVSNGELVLHFQPKIKGTTGRLAGVEALLRWQHPELGLLSPNRFMPLAEESGLILDIDEWVLSEACRQASAWRAAGIGPLPMAVNICLQWFRDRNLVRAIEEVLRNSGLSPALLTIELTETMIMENAEHNIYTLQQMKEMGLGLSIDDFGTDYSSLSYLKRFPLNELKIDRSFIKDIHTDADDAAIVAAIIAMARNLGLSVVAEGVETRQQLAFLKRYACDHYQGYFFSKPISAEELVIRMKRKPPNAGSEELRR